MEWIIETGKIAALTFATDHGGIIPTFQNPESRIQNPESPIPDLSAVLSAEAFLALAK